MDNSSNTPKVGDLVFIGRGKALWLVMAIFGDHASLRNGGRIVTKPMDKLSRS